MDIAKIRKKGKGTGLPAEQQPSAQVSQAGTEALRKAEEVPEPQEPGKERAEDNIVPRPEAEGEGATLELLTFALAQEEYAFRISEVEEIIRLQSLTKIPKSEPYLLGVTSVRGKIIPVIDLKKRLSLRGEGGTTERQKILILKGPRGTIGAVIDKVIGVIRPRSSRIGEPPPHLLETEMRFIEGVTLEDGRFISIIKTEETLNI